MLADLAAAVQHAHDRGVLHRDLKPSNILLQPGGPASPDVPSPRITDFGLARIVDDDGAGDETRSGVPFGSPPYMAPEQAAGRRRSIGPAVDVYALGATIYEVLTGRPPFQGESYLETLGQVLTLDPVAPRSLRPGLPRDLETICLKCLEKDPSRRYATAGALREDLRRFLAGEPIRARPVPARVRAAKWIRRRPTHAAAIALTGSLAAALAGGVILRDAMVERHSRQLEREVTRADANARLARRHLQAFQLRMAQQALEARQVERAQDILNASQAEREQSESGQDPGFAWQYLMKQARRDLVVLSDRRSERVSVFALTPDGRTLATGDHDGTIRTRDPGTGQVRMTLRGHELLVDLLAFSSDGRRLASVATTVENDRRRSEVLIWALDSGGEPAKVEGFSAKFVEQLAFDSRGGRLWVMSHQTDRDLRVNLIDVGMGPARPRRVLEQSLRGGRISADGRVIGIVEGPEGRLVARDIATGAVLGRTGPIDHPYERAFPTPDGRFLAVGRGGETHTLSIWDLATGRQTARHDVPRADLRAVDASPDGRFLLVNFIRGAFDVYDLRTGSRHSIAPAVLGRPPSSSFAFSPDSRLLVTNTTAPGDQPLTIRRLDPWGEVATCPEALSTAMPFLFTPDNQSLLGNDNNVIIRWDFARPPDPGQPAGHTDEAWALAFFPDGRTLASGSDDDDPETVKLWDTATGRRVLGWHAGRGTVASLAIDRTGRILASGHLATPGAVRLWDPETGRHLADLDGHAGPVRTVAISSDGTLLASAGNDRAIRLWNLASRRCVRVLEGHSATVRRVNFSPDGTLLASASNDFTTRIWEVATGRLIGTLRAFEDVAAVAFAPDGRTLATADEKGMVTTWDVARGERIQSMAFEHDFVLGIAYSPDGRSLAVAGKTRTIRLWDPVTGQEMLTLDGHKSQVNRLAFSPDGRVLASCSHDGAVHLWRADH